MYNVLLLFSPTHSQSCLLFLSSTYSVQETDGSYFENFTSLGWKRENRRMSATRAAESRAEANPENERDPPAPEESIDRQDEKEKLYVEVLHTIANTVGAPAPGGQVNCFTISCDTQVYLQAGDKENQYLG